MHLSNKAKPFHEFSIAVLECKLNLEHLKKTAL